VNALGAIGHVAYLLVFVVAGYVWGLRTYTRRLFN